MDGLSFFETKYGTQTILLYVAWACVVTPLAARTLFGWLMTTVLTAAAVVAIWFQLNDNHDWLADAPIFYGLVVLSAVAALRVLVIGIRRIGAYCRSRGPAAAR